MNIFLLKEPKCTGFKYFFFPCCIILLSWRCQIKALWQLRSLQSSWVCPFFCPKRGKYTQIGLYNSKLLLNILYSSFSVTWCVTCFFPFLFPGCCWLRRWVTFVEMTLSRVWDFTQTSFDLFTVFLVRIRKKNPEKSNKNPTTTSSY